MPQPITGNNAPEAGFPDAELIELVRTGARLHDDLTRLLHIPDRSPSAARSIHSVASSDVFVSCPTAPTSLQLHPSTPNHTHTHTPPFSSFTATDEMQSPRHDKNGYRGFPVTPEKGVICGDADGEKASAAADKNGGNHKAAGDTNAGNDKAAGPGNHGLRTNKHTGNGKPARPGKQGQAATKPAGVDKNKPTVAGTDKSARPGKQGQTGSKRGNKANGSRKSSGAAASKSSGTASSQPAGTNPPATTTSPATLDWARTMTALLSMHAEFKRVHADLHNLWRLGHLAPEYHEQTDKQKENVKFMSARITMNLETILKLANRLKTEVEAVRLEDPLLLAEIEAVIEAKNQTGALWSQAREIVGKKSEARK